MVRELDINGQSRTEALDLADEIDRLRKAEMAKEERDLASMLEGSRIRDQ
jgi:hypothetical protein